MYYYVTSMVLITATFLIAVIIGYKKRNKISKQLLTGLFLILSAGAITLAFILYPYCLTLQHRVTDVDLPFIVDQNIHPDEYGADFQEICKIVKIHYSLAELKGIDLDSLNQTYQAEVANADCIKEYYQIVCRYFASLRNLHTSLLYYPYHIIAKAQWRNDHLYITRNLSEYPLEEGDRILSINGMEAQAWRDSIIAYEPGSTPRARRLNTANQVFSNPIDSVQQLCLSRQDSVFHVTVHLARNGVELIKKDSTVELKQQNKKQEKKHKKRMEVIQLIDFSNTSTEKFISDYEKNKECTMLILDLSTNSGGLGQNAEKIASLFLKQPYRGKRLIKPVSNPYTGELYVLITRETYSAAEYLASILKESGVAILVGEETAGDFGTHCETFQTSRGTCFSLGVGVPPLTANGNLTEGVGVKPHYTITEQDDKSIRETALRKTFFMYLKKEIEKKKKEILEKRGKEDYKENKN